MSASQLLRLSGASLALGTLLGLISIIAGGLLFPEFNNPSYWSLRVSSPWRVSRAALARPPAS